MPPRRRSAVTNGKRLFVVRPGDTAWARRFADVLGQIIADIGGPQSLSEGQRQLARRCATIALACERLEGEAAAGKIIDLETYGQLTDRLGRAFARIGLKRQSRDLTPTLSEYLSSLPAEDTEDAADTDAPPEPPPPTGKHASGLPRDDAR
jgi:hypothetical protein